MQDGDVAAVRKALSWVGPLVVRDEAVVALGRIEAQLEKGKGDGGRHTERASR